MDGLSISNTCFEPNEAGNEAASKPAEEEGEVRNNAPPRWNFLNVESFKPTIAFEIISERYFTLKFRHMPNNKIRDSMRCIRRHGEDAILWDSSQGCWTIDNEHYEEAQEIIKKQTFGAGSSLAVHSIPEMTWKLMENSMPFSKNRIITIEDKTQRMKGRQGDQSRNYGSGQCGLGGGGSYGQYGQGGSYGQCGQSGYGGGSWDRSRRCTEVKVDLDYTADLEKNYSTEMIPEDLRSKLFPFQLDGVKFAISNYGRFLLGDEMGVGKTIQALATMCVYQEDWPVVIICPSTLRFNWKEEIFKWVPDQLIKSHEVNLVQGGSQQLSQYMKIHIMSYEISMKMHPQFKALGIKTAIIDEAHYLKADTSMRSAALIPVISQMKRVMLLSGTPMLSRPREAYNLIKMIRPDIMTDFWEFALRYCNPTTKFYGRDFNGAANTDELHFILDKKIMIRRLKKEVLADLPDKIRQRVIVPTEATITKSIGEILRRNFSHAKDQEALQQLIIQRSKDFLDTGEIDTGTFIKDMPRSYSGLNDGGDKEQQQITQAYKMTGQAKLKGIKDFLGQMLEQDSTSKMLVFAHHKQVMDELEEFTNRKLRNSYSIRIDGTTDPELRQKYVNSFQDDPMVRVAVLSITAAGVGITLTAASIVIFAEMTWTPSTMLQAEDRTHRIGQKNCINIYYMFGEKTLDEVIFPMIQVKGMVIAKSLDGENSSGFNLKKAMAKSKLVRCRTAKDAEVKLEDERNYFNQADPSTDCQVNFPIKAEIAREREEGRATAGDVREELEGGAGSTEGSPDLQNLNRVPQLAESPPSREPTSPLPRPESRQEPAASSPPAAPLPEAVPLRPQPDFSPKSQSSIPQMSSNPAPKSELLLKQEGIPPCCPEESAQQYLTGGEYPGPDTSMPTLLKKRMNPNDVDSYFQMEYDPLDPKQATHKRPKASSYQAWSSPSQSSYGGSSYGCSPVKSEGSLIKTEPSEPQRPRPPPKRYSLFDPLEAFKREGITVKTEEPEKKKKSNMKPGKSKKKFKFVREKSSKRNETASEQCSKEARPPQAHQDQPRDEKLQQNPLSPAETRVQGLNPHRKPSALAGSKEAPSTAPFGSPPRFQNPESPQQSPNFRKDSQLAQSQQSEPTSVPSPRGKVYNPELPPSHALSSKTPEGTSPEQVEASGQIQESPGQLTETTSSKKKKRKKKKKRPAGPSFQQPLAKAQEAAHPQEASVSSPLAAPFAGPQAAPLAALLAAPQAVPEARPLAAAGASLQGLQAETFAKSPYFKK